MYNDVRISGFGLPEYAEHIPVNYHSQIQKDELDAIAVYDGEKSEDNFIGVIVTADHSGWLEIVWISLNKDRSREEKAADLLRYRVRKARLSGNYTGAFAEIHKDEKTTGLRKILILAGFDITETNNNIYEFALKDVTDTKLIDSFAAKVKCVSVADAQPEVLADIESIMEYDDRPVPAPKDFEWDKCERNLSLLSMENDSPTGLLYFMKEADYLVLELAFSASPAALSGMLGNAVRIASSIYPDDQKFLVPIVGKGTNDIVTHIVPGAKRGTIEEAIIWFDKPDMPKSMEVILNRMKNGM